MTSPPSAPLDPLTSIKVKLAVLVGVSVLVAAVLGAIGRGRRGLAVAEHPDGGRGGARGDPAAGRRDDLAAARR